MKISCGTDIIEIARIKKVIENNNKFLDEVYTKNEIEYCENRKGMKYQHYAARFAGKEATFKAISNILDNKYAISWKNIEIINNQNGKPVVNLIEINLPQILSIDISISHCKEYATANVVVLYKEEE